MLPTRLPSLVAIATTGLPPELLKRLTYATIGGEQPEYLPLSVLRLKNDQYGQVISRWKLSWRERVHMLLFGSFFISQLTFGGKLQPIRPHCLLREGFEYDE